MPSWGVYAPIPSQETGSVLTVSVEGGVHFDSNILGTPDNEIDSMVFTVSPQIKYNVSLAEQSFLTAHYKLGGFFTNSARRTIPSSTMSSTENCPILFPRAPSWIFPIPFP